MDSPIHVVRSLADTVTLEGFAWLFVRLTAFLALGHLAIALLASRATAATRHLVALATLGTALAMPMAATFMPAGPELVLPASVVSALPALRAIIPAAPTVPAVLAPIVSMPVPPRALNGVLSPTRAGRDAAVMPPIDAHSTWPAEASLEPRLAAPIAPVSASLESPPAVAALVAWRPIALPVLPWTAWLALLGIAGASGLVARLAVGIAVAGGVLRDAVPLTDAGMRAEFERARDQLSIRESVAVLMSDRVSVPVVVGFLRSALLMPSHALGWTPERRRAVWLHELAHIRRRDGLALLFSRVATALLWFHPLVWTLARTARRECERACDDVVLAVGVRASDYADHLLAIARTAARRERLPSLTLAFARNASLEGRLLALLRADAPRGPATRRVIATIVCLAFLMLLPVASLRVVAAPRDDAHPTLAEERAAELDAERLDAVEDAGAQMDADARAEDLVFRARVRVRAAAERILAKNPPQEGETATLDEALAESGCNSATGVTTPEPDLVPQSVVPVITADVVASAKLAARAYALAKSHSTASRVGEQAYDRAVDLYDAVRFAQAAESFSSAAKAGFRPGTAWYNAACSFALAGQRERALDALSASLDEGFDRLDLIQSDTDLNAIRSDRRFKTLLDDAMSSGTFKTSQRSAVAEYDALRAAHSTDADAWHSVGIDLLRSSEPSRSADAFDRQYKLDQSPNALYNMACAHAVGGDRARALATLERSILNGVGSGADVAEDPDLISLHGDREFERLLRLVTDLTLERDGLHVSNWHDKDQTAEWRRELPRFERTTREHPEFGRAWSNLGLAQLRARSPKASLASLKRALELGYRRPTTMYNLACAAAQADDLDGAIEWLRRAEKEGMSVWGQAPHDEDLAPLRSDTRFREMVRDWRTRSGERGEWRKKRDGSWSYNYNYKWKKT